MIYLVPHAALTVSSFWVVKLDAQTLTDCQVHVVSLSQCSEPVQAATLIVVLEELDKACKKRSLTPLLADLSQLQLCVIGYWHAELGNLKSVNIYLQFKEDLHECMTFPLSFQI